MATSGSRPAENRSAASTASIFDGNVEIVRNWRASPSDMISDSRGTRRGPWDVASVRAPTRTLGKTVAPFTMML
jgi:hypothetical protein